MDLPPYTQALTFPDFHRHPYHLCPTGVYKVAVHLIQVFETGKIKKKIDKPKITQMLNLLFTGVVLKIL